MSAFLNVQNIWAPETYWDEQTKDWLIIWSSNFNATTTTPAEGLRIWSAHTADLNTFTKPAIFFDPGFLVIDATCSTATSTATTTSSSS